jgi:hypothetical protein
MSELTYTLVVNHLGTYDDAVSVFATDTEDAASGKLLVMLDGQYTASNVPAGSKNVKLLTVAPDYPKNKVFMTPEFKLSEIVSYEYFPSFSGVGQSVLFNFQNVSEELFVRIEERNGINVNNTFTVSSSSGIAGLIEQLEERRLTFGLENLLFQGIGDAILLITVLPVNDYSYVFTANPDATKVVNQNTANLKPRVGDRDTLAQAVKQADITSGVYNQWSHPIVSPGLRDNNFSQSFDILVLNVEQVKRGRTSAFTVRLFLPPTTATSEDFIPVFNVLLGKTAALPTDTVATLNSIVVNTTSESSTSHLNFEYDDIFDTSDTILIQYTGADVPGTLSGTVTVEIHGIQGLVSSSTQAFSVAITEADGVADTELSLATLAAGPFTDESFPSFGYTELKASAIFTDALSNVSVQVESTNSIFTTDVGPTLALEGTSLTGQAYTANAEYDYQEGMLVYTEEVLVTDMPSGTIGLNFQVGGSDIQAQVVILVDDEVQATIDLGTLQAQQVFSSDLTGNFWTSYDNEPGVLAIKLQIKDQLSEFQDAAKWVYTMTAGTYALNTSSLKVGSNFIPADGDIVLSSYTDDVNVVLALNTSHDSDVSISATWEGLETPYTRLASIGTATTTSVTITNWQIGPTASADLTLPLEITVTYTVTSQWDASEITGTLTYQLVE